MTHAELQKVLDYQLRRVRVIHNSKSHEYGGADPLRNIKSAAALQGVSLKEAVGGSMAKHISSIFHMIPEDEQEPRWELEVWEEKITDTINWLILLFACLLEEREEDIDIVTDVAFRMSEAVRARMEEQC